MSGSSLKACCTGLIKQVYNYPNFSSLAVGATATEGVMYFIGQPEDRGAQIALIAGGALTTFALMKGIKRYIETFIYTNSSGDFVITQKAIVTMRAMSRRGRHLEE